MNLGGTKTSPVIMQRTKLPKKRSAQTPCMVSDCESGYREGKNLMLVKRCLCLPAPPALSDKAWPQSCSPNLFLPLRGTA